MLGPLLFLIYCADLPSLILSLISSYADDTKIYNNPLTSHDILQDDLDRVMLWCSEWLIPLNIEKCVIVHLGKNNPRLEYTIGGLILKVVESHNDLGVTITSNLSWSSHINKICSKAKTMMYLLSKCFERPSPAVAKKMFITYIRPHLEFAGPVWCAELVRDANLLESVQRAATRLAYPYRNRPPYEERLRIFDLMPFRLRRMRGDLIIAFRALNHFFPLDMSHLFTLNVDERLRGHRLKLRRERFRSRAREHFLSNRIFDVWNGLPDDVVAASSVNVFKNRLDLLGLL